VFAVKNLPFDPVPQFIQDLKDFGKSLSSVVVDPFNKEERVDGLAGAVKTNQGSNTSTGTGLMISQSRSNKYRIHRNDEKKSEVQGYSFFEPEGIIDIVDDHPKNIIVQPLRFLNRNQRNFDETAMTVDTTNSTGIREGTRIRRLTPVECERLQGFPDGWTQYGIDYITVQPSSNPWKGINAQLRVAKEPSLIESHPYVLCITNDGENGATQLSLIPESRYHEQNANTVIGLAKMEPGGCVCDTINLGNVTAILSRQSKTSKIETITKSSLISEKMENLSTSPLWKIHLDENLPKEKLSIILTSIKEIIKSRTFTSLKLEENIINAIVLSKPLPSNYSQKELSPLKKAVIVEISDTQRYRCLGNAVTVPVIKFLGDRIRESMNSKSKRTETDE